MNLLFRLIFVICHLTLMMSVLSLRLFGKLDKKMVRQVFHLVGDLLVWLHILTYCVEDLLVSLGCHLLLRRGLENL